MFSGTRIAGAVATVTVAAALPLSSSALAYSGSISGITPNSDGTVTATYSSTVTSSEVCFSDGSGICGWYPVAWQVPSTQACGAEDSNNLTYVGDFWDVPGTQTGSDFFYPQYSPLRLCLEASSVNGDYLVADAVYAPSTAPPTTSPPPAQLPVAQPPVAQPPAPAVETLALSEAKSAVRVALRRKFGSRFAHRSRYRAVCGRLSRIRFRCHASWNHRGHWKATVTVWGGVQNGEQYVYWRISGIHRPSKRRPSAPPSRNFCDTHTCIPNFDNGTGYIVQCNDGEWSHSGGRPGACSGHGGVSAASASVRSDRSAALALNRGEDRARLAGRWNRVSLDRLKRTQAR